MNFKEAIKNDLTTFLNLDEFAETHNLRVQDIDYFDIPCSVDKDEIIASTQRVGAYDREGVFVLSVKLFVKSEDITKPVEGERLYIDDEMFIVSKVSDNLGMLEINLERNDF